MPDWVESCQLKSDFQKKFYFNYDFARIND